MAATFIHPATSPSPSGPGPATQASPSDTRAPRPFFTRFSQQVAKFAGKPVTFFGAALVIVIWGATGPLFDYNDTWQLIINTSTTIVTFLMVFLIQNSQNRDTAALQIKLDELIARTHGPRNALLDLEDLDEETLEKLRADYARLADLARGEAGEGASRCAPDRSFAEICAPEDVVSGSAICKDQDATMYEVGDSPASQRPTVAS